MPRSLTRRRPCEVVERVHPRRMEGLSEADPRPLRLTHRPRGSGSLERQGTDPRLTFGSSAAHRDRQDAERRAAEGGTMMPGLATPLATPLSQTGPVGADCSGAKGPLTRTGAVRPGSGGGPDRSYKEGVGGSSPSAPTAKASPTWSSTRWTAEGGMRWRRPMAVRFRRPDRLGKRPGASTAHRPGG